MKNIYCVKLKNYSETLLVEAQNFESAFKKVKPLQKKVAKACAEPITRFKIEEISLYGSVDA